MPQKYFPDMNDPSVSMDINDIYYWEFDWVNYTRDFFFLSFSGL